MGGGETVATDFESAPLYKKKKNVAPAHPIAAEKINQDQLHKMSNEQLCQVAVDLAEAHRPHSNKLDRQVRLDKLNEAMGNLLINKGPKELRKAFSLDSAEYAEIWEYVMDYLGIASGAIYAHVNKNASHYQDLIRKGKASKIRKTLELEKPKYDAVWEEILDILLECISFTNFSHSQFEQGIRLFTNLYNSGRKHRSLNLREVES